MDLAGNPIVIAGASSGIGAATAAACAAAGMPVALGARRADRLGELADRINADGGRAVWAVTDVTDPDQCKSLIDLALDEFGSFHAVFANAGYGIDVPFAEMTDEQMRAIFEANFFGTLNTIRPALPYMIEARRGHVLICSSCLARLAIPRHGAYCATKAAQHHIGRAMNIELHNTGVRVSTVHPIGTRTEFFEQARKRSEHAPLIDVESNAFTQPPQTVARAIVRCLRRPKPEVWTSLPARIAFGMSNLAPTLTDRLVRLAYNRRMTRERS